MRITFRQLAVFEAIARTGSIVRAAADINLSQPAVSLSLKELEAHLGIELFRREGGKLWLSDHGQRLQARVKSLLVQAEEIERLAGLDAPAGRLRIGATPALGNHVLPARIAGFLAAHPGVHVELTVTSSLRVMREVQRMTLDLGFIGAPCNNPELDARPWIEDPLVVFCAPSHPLAARAGGPPLALAALQAEPWFLEKPFSSERISLTVELLKELASISVAFEADSIEAVRRAVAAGHGIGCLSRIAIAEDLARGTLAALPVRELDFTRVFSLIRRRDLTPGATQSAFLDFIAASPQD